MVSVVATGTVIVVSGMVTVVATGVVVVVSGMVTMMSGLSGLSPVDVHSSMVLMRTVSDERRG